MPTRRIVTATAALVFVSMAAGNAQVSSGIRIDGDRAGALPEEGWWIRVNAESDATALRWSVITSPKAPLFKIMWEGNRNPSIFAVLSGVPETRPRFETVIDFPATHRSLQAFTLDVTAEPPNATASFCVFFKDRGVQLIEFSGSNQTQLTQHQADRKCIP